MPVQSVLSHVNQWKAVCITYHEKPGKIGRSSDELLLHDA